MAFFESHLYYTDQCGSTTDVKAAPAKASLMTKNRELVFTPGGPRLQSQVHLIGHGRPYIHGLHPLIAMRRRARPGPPDQSNWITCAGWLNNTGQPIRSLSAIWQVPAAPSVVGSQLLYLFNGIEPDDGSTIVQPVLQWGDSGPDEDGVQRTGSFWTAGCWIVPAPDGHSYHTPHVAVSPGELLNGVIKLSHQTDSEYIYECQFEGIPSSVMTTPPLPELVWCMHTLEAYELEGHKLPPYDLNSVDEYFPGNTIFKAINVQTGTIPGIATWTTEDFVTSFGEKTVVSVNSFTQGVVDIILHDGAM
jgi:hypothetical protein